MSTRALSAWFETPLGQYVLARERAALDEQVPDIFGFNAVQIGLPEIDLLATSRMPLRVSLADYGPAGILARPEELPIATQSVDLVVLPHTLEFAREPHQILREVDRVMMPEGRLIVTGFNPWSLWGVRQAFTWSRDSTPWCANFIALTRIKDWLALLGFDVSAGRLCCYAPPFTKEKWLERCSSMEKAGDRWWGIAGGVYIVQAIKRVHSMRLIVPKWEPAVVRTRIAQAAPLRGSPQRATAKIVPLVRRP